MFSGWLDGPGGEVAGQVGGRWADVMRCLSESGNHQARVKLAADLPGHCVAVLQRYLGAPQFAEFPRIEVSQVGVGQAVPDKQLASVVASFLVEDEHVRIHEPGQQRPARTE